MAHPTVYAVCEWCENRFLLPYVRRGDVIREGLVLDFSRCTRCGKERNQTYALSYLKSRKCLGCNVPHELQRIVRRGRCASCYLRWHRNVVKISKSQVGL